MIFRRLRRSTRGGVTVAIAIMMAMAVMIAFIQNILVWEQHLGSEDRDRKNEEITLDPPYFEGDDTTLIIPVRNTGALSTNIASIWVENARYDLDTHLNIEEVKEFTIVDPGYTPEDNFIVYAYTDRGNLDSRTYTLIEEEEPPTWDVGETGVFKIDWFYCKYSSTLTGGNLLDAIIISKQDTYVAFYLNITNQWDHPCVILSESFLTLTSLSMIGATEEPIFYTVKELDYTNPNQALISQAYTDEDPLIVLPGVDNSVIVKFAADNASAISEPPQTWDAWKWGRNCPTQQSGTEGAGIQISLFYYNSMVPIPDPETIYGQTISTQAVILIED